MLAEIFMKNDINNDGSLNIDGFTSSLLEMDGLSEHTLNLKEIK